MTDSLAKSLLADEGALLQPAGHLLHHCVPHTQHLHLHLLHLLLLLLRHLLLHCVPHTQHLHLRQISNLKELNPLVQLEKLFRMTIAWRSKSILIPRWVDLMGHPAHDAPGCDSHKLNIVIINNQYCHHRRRTLQNIICRRQ